MKSKKKVKNSKQHLQVHNWPARLSGLTANQAYSFTKEGQPELFSQVINLIQQGYQISKTSEMESVDLVFSGNTSSQLLLPIVVGRMDRFKRSKVLDIDVFNIAPEVSVPILVF